MNEFINIQLGNGVTLQVRKNVGDGDNIREFKVVAIANGVTTNVALIGASADDGDTIHTYAYNDIDDEPVETHINVGWKPVKYDPEKADQFDSGTYYDGTEIFSIRDYDDEEVDYDAGYIGCLTIAIDPESDDLYCDGLWTGYHSTNECMEDLWHTDNVWRIYPDGFDVCDMADLENCLKDVGIDLKQAMKAIDELL